MEEFIVLLYEAYNKREVDVVLGYFHPDIEWPNSWEGGYVHGREAVREYWSRQWKELNPTVTPAHFTELENGKLEVEVIQIVKDLQGQVLSNKLLRHQFRFRDNLIIGMEIVQ